MSQSCIYHLLYFWIFRNNKYNNQFVRLTLMIWRIFVCFFNSYTCIIDTSFGNILSILLLLLICLFIKDKFLIVLCFLFTFLLAVIRQKHEVKKNIMQLQRKVYGFKFSSKAVFTFLKHTVLKLLHCFRADLLSVALSFTKVNICTLYIHYRNDEI